MAIMRLPEVSSRTGLARATIYAQVKKGTFPRPVQLTRRAVGWIEDEIEEWITSRRRTERQAAGGEASEDPAGARG